MNGEARNKTFDEAAREFEKTPATIKLLEPYKERIAELRSKGASYRFISDLLKHDNVTVSRMSVARFCYAVLKPKSGRKRNGHHASVEGTHVQSSVQPLVANCAVLHKTAPSNPNRESIGPWTSRKRGPRIADSKNL